jgi:hypothetical protein
MICGACSGRGVEVPSLVDPAGTSNSAQADLARDLVDCMARANIPMEVVDIGNNEATVVPTTDGIWAIEHPNGSGKRIANNPNVTAADWERFNALHNEVREARAGQSLLIVGDVDLSADYSACIAETGYMEPGYAADLAENLKWRQAFADAGAVWATCARTHGYPELIDPDPPRVGDDEPDPAVLLPGDISESALRELLQVCPVFDRAIQEAFDKNASQDPDLVPEEMDDYPIWPIVDFDFDGALYGHVMADPLAREKLYEILTAEQNEYLASLS